MKQFQYKITDMVGLHARPAGMLVKEAKNYESKVTVSKDGKSADASKLMMLMSLGVKHGDVVTVEVSGVDEEIAVAGLEAFFKANL